MQAINSKANEKKVRNESVETNDIKRMLLNGTDQIEQNQYVIPSVKPISDKSNVLVYSRSLNEDEVDEIVQYKAKRKSSFEVLSEH